MNVKLDELVELSSKYGFWLKPICKLNITVQLPQLNTGKAINTTSIMEKINKRAKEQFKSLKITKTTIDFLRLEGELDSLKQLDVVQKRLDRVKIKLDGFDEQLKLKATKLKIGPFKHDWETFFRDNPHMDEMKPGYRPDTVVIQNLPLKWFGEDTLKTNWLIAVFSVYGDIRRFHVPLLDEMEKMKSAVSGENGFKKFNFNSEHSTFDVYLMYKDYVGFVNAIDALRGMKLVKYLSSSKSYNKELIEYEIKIDFDRTKHLSDKAIRRRQIAKKYGINTLEDLNEYKKKAKERKALYEERKKQLKKQKKSSKNLLNYLVRLVEIDEKKRTEEEKNALNERLLKERLIEEEKKLRNKLIERQRALMIEKSAKEKGELDFHTTNKELDSSNQSFDDSNHRPYDSNSSFNQEYSNQTNRFENSNYSNQSKNQALVQRKPEFIFKNPSVHSHFNSHINSTQFSPNFRPRFRSNQEPNNTFSVRMPYHLKSHQNTPYQANNRNTFSYNEKKSNFYNSNYQERSNYQTRSNYQDNFDYQNKLNYQDRSNNYQDRPNNYQDRPSNYQDRPNNYQDRSNNYQNRSDYMERSNSYSDRSNYQNDNQDKLNRYDKLSYDRPFDRSYTRSNDESYDKNYNKNYDRPFDRPYTRSNDESNDKSQDMYYDKSYDKYYDKSYDKSYDKPFKSNRYDNEKANQSDEEKSRPKSFVVLPQKIDLSN